MLAMMNRKENSCEKYKEHKEGESGVHTFNFIVSCVHNIAYFTNIATSILNDFV